MAFQKSVRMDSLAALKEEVEAILKRNRCIEKSDSVMLTKVYECMLGIEYSLK